jgi:hypothetical protein
VGELSISSNKFLQSFRKEIGEIVKKANKVETLTDLERGTKKSIDRAFDKLSKKQIELSPQKLYELHNKGFA